MDALSPWADPWAALVRPNLPRLAGLLAIWGVVMSVFLTGLLEVGPVAVPAMRIGLPNTLLGTAMMTVPCAFAPLLLWFVIVRPRWLRDPALRQRIQREGMYAALPLWQHVLIYVSVNTAVDSLMHPLWIETMTAFDLWGQASSRYYTLSNSVFIGVFGTCLLIAIDMIRVRQHHTRLRAEAAQRQLAEARLQRLQAQLEPHMLFNTLSNLHALIETDPPRAQDMLAHLIDFMRATLGASRAGKYTLAEEMRLVQDYLALMQIRMGHRLTVHVHLPESLRQHPWPPMLLQPLVENAIKHGLDPLPQGGQLWIQAWVEGHSLCVSVRDDGVGLPDPPPDAAARGHEGFGVSCVRDRLLTAYGDHAQLSLAPSSPRGTQVIVRLPHDGLRADPADPQPEPAILSPR